jgi:hemolysin activation/secretion protein
LKPAASNVSKSANCRVGCDYGYVQNKSLQPGDVRPDSLSSVGVGLRYVLDRYLDFHCDYGWQLHKLNGSARQNQLAGIALTLSY